MGGFEFVALAALRASQLIRGCLPTVEAADHRPTIVAQLEVAAGRISHASSVAAVVAGADGVDVP
jgi:DNA-directed RNA polymerase subunit K/omega